MKYVAAGGLGAVLVAGFFLGPAAWQAYQDRKALSAFTAVVQSANATAAQRRGAPLLPVPAPAQWVTIKPKSTEVCKQESMGVLDDTYRRCRNGRQEFVTEVNGRRTVLSERAIPTY